MEMARTMLDEHRTPRKYWAEAVNTACYVSNRIFLRAFMHKTSYELRFGRQPLVDHLRVFGCWCFVLKEGNLDKFESHSTDGIFLGYASHSRAYRVLLIDGQHLWSCFWTRTEFSKRSVSGLEQSFYLSPVKPTLVVMLRRFNR